MSRTYNYRYLINFNGRWMYSNGPAINPAFTNKVSDAIRLQQGTMKHSRWMRKDFVDLYQYNEHVIISDDEILVYALQVE